MTVRPRPLVACSICGGIMPGTPTKGGGHTIRRHKKLSGAQCPGSNISGHWPAYQGGEP